MTRLWDVIIGIVIPNASHASMAIFLTREKTRLNVIDAAWFHATPDPESIELALEASFHETPLDAPGVVWQGLREESTG